MVAFWPGASSSTSGEAQGRALLASLGGANHITALVTLIPVRSVGKNRSVGQNTDLVVAFWLYIRRGTGGGFIG